MQLFAQHILVDQHEKATNFRLHSFKHPHMRALHLAWISFMVAFMAWYSIPPLVDYIAAELKIASAEVYDSNVVAVSATILTRLVVGPLCERFGPRRMMAGILICGAIPCAMTGLLKNASGLIGLRFVIGVLGSTFIPCQFWATQMFAPSVLGTANAISAGWGNMGAGVTYLVMPAIFNGIRRHVPTHRAWRIVFVIPSGICIAVAIIDLFFATDTPRGDWLQVRRDEAIATTGHSISGPLSGQDDKLGKGKNGDLVTELHEARDDESIAEVKKNESALDSFISFCRVLTKPSVLITVCQYACSFGTELAIDNVIGQVFKKKFALDPSTASYIGSIFGLLNICSRFSGGLFSDFLAHRFHLPGRILAQLIGMSLEGAFLIGFSFSLTSIQTSIAVMIFFSFFVQFVCGTTFAIVPFIDPTNNGKVMGIVGAGGNLGGLIFNLMFRGFNGKFEQAFICLGCVSLGVGILGCALLRVQNKSMWNLYK